MPKITKRLIDALKPDPGGSEVLTWDVELKGFGVRLMPSGVATYLVKYRTPEGRQRKLALGRVGTITPDEARSRAREALAGVARGEDPSAERTRLRRSMTVAELCDLYLADAVGRVKASTLAMDRSRIDTHVKPLVGRLKVLSLTPQDLANLQSDIQNGRTAKPRNGRGGVTTGGPGVATRTLGMMGTILEFARKRRLIASNPARDVARLPEGRQQRFLSLDEIALMGRALAAAQAVEDVEGALAGLTAIPFLLLSGFRRMEGLGLRSEWVARAAGCARFPDTKSGAQVRPLGAAALEVIEDRVGLPGWVFPSGRGDGHFIGLPKVLDRICTAAGLKDVTPHVLRHTFAATAAAMGYSELTIAGLLGHRIGGVTARYAHVPDRALVAAADAVSDRIAEALLFGWVRSSARGSADAVRWAA